MLAAPLQLPLPAAICCCRRDVLNVLGMYPGDPGPPGSDCAGVVLRVGNGVQHLQPGKPGTVPSTYEPLHEHCCCI